MSDDSRPNFFLVRFINARLSTERPTEARVTENYVAACAWTSETKYD